MAVYHQMGHHSDNLLSEPALNTYTGAILSPVNNDEQQMARQISSFRRISDPRIILDPQLYYPRTDRSKLRKWSYFPSDFTTIDSASPGWWEQVVTELAEVATRLRVDAICSPAFVPRVFADSYFDLMTNVAGSLVDAAAVTGINVLQTLLVRGDDLSEPDRVFAISSIITRTQAEEVYLVILSDQAPRREATDTEMLKGAMLLIQTLESSGIKVLVSYCSSDVILWKAAGADACATGKFWNLRRFTPSRWDSSENGGGQLAYWFEESLVAALRESDLIRVQGANLLSDESYRNPYGIAILQQIEESPGQAWVGLGWRQFLYWFADIESRLAGGYVDAETLLRNADRTWQILDNRNLFMEERFNDGGWIRPWLRAVLEV